MGEIWKPVKGYEGLYEISDEGHVRRADSGRAINPTSESGGYLRVRLKAKDGKDERKTIHRLVAEAFIENPENLPLINHKDENKKNNRAENLEWCSCFYNVCYGTARERATETLKANHPRYGNMYYYHRVPVPDDVYKEIEKRCKVMKITKTVLIRQILSDYLDQSK